MSGVPMALMPVEEAVQGVESIEEMVSTAREGSGVIAQSM